MFQCYGFKLQVTGNVYEPDEDTFLMIRALNELDLKDNSVLEIGTGSGTIALILAKKAKSVTASDMNPEAIACAKENARLNNINNANFVQCDMFKKIKGTFDLIVFNPPYLPSEPGHTSNAADLCWDGGKNGRRAITRFIRSAPKFLNNNGRIILLESSLSHYEKTIQYFRKTGMCAEIIAKEKIDWEELVVLQITNKAYNE